LIVGAGLATAAPVLATSPSPNAALSRQITSLQIQVTHLTSAIGSPLAPTPGSVSGQLDSIRRNTDGLSLSVSDFKRDVDGKLSALCRLVITNPYYTGPTC
jgi:hypothetical protein